MSNDLAIYLSRQLLWNALFISFPVILTALLSGLIISILQAVTQIQDSSLSAVPKMLAVMLMLMLCGEWMLHALINFARNMLNHIPSVVG